MQESRAAAPEDAGRVVMIDLDDKIVEMIVALEPVSALTAIPPHRLIVMAALRIFAPGVVGPDGANPQERRRPQVSVRAPPQFPGPAGASWGCPVPPTP